MGSLASNNIFDNVIPKTDPLDFGLEKDEIDYKKVSKFLEFDNNDLSKISGISKKSVRLDNKIPKELKNHLIQIAQICSLVAEYFNGNPTKTALWFTTTNPLLGDISPRDMVRIGRYKKLIKFITEARNHNGTEQTQ